MEHTKIGDFKRYYDTESKRNYWVLGYFGGGAVDICEAYQLAKEYSELVSVPIETVKIDEILSSRRFKGFKFIFSTVENQKPEPESYQMKDVYSWLRD